ncbi:uncharacterized protein G2W53_013814 [Senna tora]|uniref:Uncharacterized protein n=1 Tax=Senna tora TaxID=362788 RepID=A0A834U237_9FABA|nr:uncharacterized protein G2W53_013814 [Senna tora]
MGKLRGVVTYPARNCNPIRDPLRKTF